MQAVGGLSRVAAAVPDGVAPAVGPLPGFHHKAALHAGEGQAVVVACLHKACKVIIGLRSLVREKHRLEHACRGIEHRNGVPRRRWANCSSADSTAGRSIFWTVLPPLPLPKCRKLPALQPVSTSAAASTNAAHLFLCIISAHAPYSIVTCTTHRAQKIQRIVYHILPQSARANA